MMSNTSDVPVVQLKQLKDAYDRNDAVWDGYLISKKDRDKLVELGLAERMQGFNTITLKGREYLDENYDIELDFGYEDDGSNKDSIFDELRSELENAEEKYPEPNPNFRALVSEVGELAESLIDLERYEDNTPEELLQVAVMALRIAKQKSNKLSELQDELEEIREEAQKSCACKLENQTELKFQCAYHEEIEKERDILQKRYEKARELLSEIDKAKELLLEIDLPNSHQSGLLEEALDLLTIDVGEESLSNGSYL